MATAATKRAASALPRQPTPRLARPFFNFPSPFGSSSSPSTSSPERKGTLQKENGVWVYREEKIMPYSPSQLFSVIADVDSYQSFLPFTTSSRVLTAARLEPDGRRVSQPVAEKGWLRGTQGERWEMDGELRIGAMGFDEGYVSLVEMEKDKWVKATAKDATMFRHLSTIWSFSPSPSSAPSSSAPQTKVDLYLAYAFTSPLHAAAIQSVWDKVSGLMVEKFEKRVRDVHGPPAQR
ncbi:hypothetical protein RTG_01145 [Rhodotorula toruloides ATCC 204091]|uniref:Coenzyme Q-binding protein COQ10 START domain-containing protein n=1 Tax=Rhodotorula toruloides TaxID=5286 RepID=A0A0K3C428_RHOTO|nr:hypothetical protein RTG_01145 [Rhodotorula toruloides ATCC 204091]KAK4333390.1 Polyketide_cyc domain-containing protein [Rhodotorula toruloides]PRQ77491.1 hypothetical protein AAT19DRAFT_8559 [Rhodotorula toruloides]